MTRTENDLRDALRDLERRATEHGAPSTASILTHTSEGSLGRHRTATVRRAPRWLAPLAAAALVVAAAGTVAVLSGGQADGNSPAAGPSSGAPTTSSPSASPSTAIPSPTPKLSAAAAVLEDAAAKLDAAPPWTTPAPDDFFYVRTTDVTTWTSVSGAQAGDGRTSDGSPVTVPGCKDGKRVASGESGTCTLDDVPHYRADAPTTPTAWDAYLERMAPGAKAAGDQGKIIVQVLHQDLLAPKATAALLRYTKTCGGLRTLTVPLVAGRTLVGVTCTSMAAGSYGLTFDATSHALVGFVVVTPDGKPSGPAEIVRETGIVSAIGDTP